MVTYPYLTLPQIANEPDSSSLLKKRVITELKFDSLTFFVEFHLRVHTSQH